VPKEKLFFGVGVSNRIKLSGCWSMWRDFFGGGESVPSNLILIQRHCRNSDDSGIGRNWFGDDGIGADFCAITDCYVTENFGAATDDDIVTESGMALDGFEINSAQGDALKNQTVVTDFGRLADHHAHSMIDHESFAEFRARVNFDSSQEAPDFTKQAREEKQTISIKLVRNSMKKNGFGAWIKKRDFQNGFRRGIVIFVSSQKVQHLNRCPYRGAIAAYLDRQFAIRVKGLMVERWFG
jgi:hypothetical protein